MNIRQAFKNYPIFREQLARLQREGAGEAVGRVESDIKMKARIAFQLFDKAALKPGGLDRFMYFVEKDTERYAREHKLFKE